MVDLTKNLKTKAINRDSKFYLDLSVVRTKILSQLVKKLHSKSKKSSEQLVSPVVQENN